MIKFIFGFFMGMLLTSWIDSHDTPEPIDLQEEVREPKPDPNREVRRYDWKTKSYEYKDSNESTPELIPLTRQLESLPDASVRIVPSSPESAPSTQQYIMKDGKRYRMRTRGDGTIVLDPWK